MHQLAWQKSSFSTCGSGECIELAASPTGRIHLRESDRPTEIATTSPTALAALLSAIKDRRH
jgi:hypothetical protein